MRKIIAETSTRGGMKAEINREKTRTETRRKQIKRKRKEEHLLKDTKIKILKNKERNESQTKI